MNILVTGGNGFIGSHLVERLIKEEHSVTVLDNHPSSFCLGVNNKINTFIIGTEDSKCESIFSDTQFDVVVYLAMYTPDRESGELDGFKSHVNLIGLSNILFLSQKYQIKKVIVLSSYHVYGLQEHFPIPEEAQLKPNSKIGYHYQMRELICEDYHRNGLNVIILRFGSIYGPRQRPGSQDHIQNLIFDVLSCVPVKIEKKSDFVADYIYVNDAVETIVLTIGIDTPGVMNISSGTGITRKEILRCCMKLIHEQADISFGNHDDETIDKIMACEIADESGRVNKENDAIRRQGQEFDFVLDNQKATQELVWLPKYSLEEGMRKTIECSLRRDEHGKGKKSEIAKSGSGKHTPNQYTLRVAETFAFFGLAALAAYLTAYSLEINFDTLLLYVAIISLFYGIRQGSIAITLATAARFFLMITVEGRTVLSLIYDVNFVMQIMLYLVLGVSIGYASDSKNQRIESSIRDLTNTRRELDFVNDLYRKSLEVKKALQEAIENNKNSLSKSFHIISRLERADKEHIYDEIANVFADTLTASHVHVYRTVGNGSLLKFAASVGNKLYDDTIQSSQLSFLKTVVKDHSIFINRDFKAGCPLVCAPVVQNGWIIAFIFIDGISFNNLTQYSINTIKALTALVSESMVRKLSQLDVLDDDKYYKDTYILKKEWFAQFCQEKTRLCNNKAVLLRVKGEIHNYQPFSRNAARLLRTGDAVGELSNGQLGIFMSNVDHKDVPQIRRKLLKKGLSVEPVSSEVGMS